MKNLFKHIAFCLLLLFSFSKTKANTTDPKSPTSLVQDNQGFLYVACKTSNQILKVDSSSGLTIGQCQVDLPPTGLAIKENKLYVTTTYSQGELLELSIDDLKILRKVNVGFGANSPVLHPSKDIIYVANQYSNDISVVNLKEFKETVRIPVLRQPMAMDITPNGKQLYVANLLPAMRADIDIVASEISVIDTKKNHKIKDILLANGSNALRGVKMSSDGAYVFISHNLGRFQVPTSQLEQGWMNTSAMSVIKTKSIEYAGTVLLDEPDQGAAASWGIATSEDRIFVAHSGTHDVSVIDYNKFIEKLQNTEDFETLSYNLTFMNGIRKRLHVPGNGPREILYSNKQLYAATYFSDSISVLDLQSPELKFTNLATLTPNMELTEVRRGEIYFNDASYCFQKWQACTGCHPNDGRTDGLNWDLLNDGLGNPKNCKSMLYSHATPPTMISGIRPNGEACVRAGFRHIQFVQIPEAHSAAVDSYMKSLTPVPSPYLVNDTLSEKAEKGQQIFKQLRCDICHNGKYLTDMHTHTMGTQGDSDHQNTWDTPTLLEIWRTGPYLHDGRSATIKEVFENEKHGISSDLSEEDLNNLVEYVLSL